MDKKVLKKLADQLDEIAAGFTAVSGTFRLAAGDDGGEGVDAAPARPGKTASSASAKTVKGKKPAAKADEGADDIDIETVREKLQELAEAKGKDVMVAALESVGAGKLADVDESQYQELLDKAQELLDAEDEPEEEALKKPAAKTAKGKAKAVTLEQVTEAAKALIEAAKPEYLKLVKKLGKPSEMDESDYAAALKAFTDAMPAEEAEDDLL